jgi:ATP-dependent helicase/nuclease subunit B
MLAVRNAADSEIKNVAGAFYMPVEVSPEKTTLDEIPKKTEKFAYKAHGIFNGELFHHLDNSDSNRFYNFFVTKKGDQYGKKNISGALEPADFEKVLKYAEKMIIESMGKILSGCIDVRPYRLSGKSPCSYCKFNSVCRFDWQINDYKHLITLGKTKVLNKMEVVNG